MKKYTFTVESVVKAGAGKFASSILDEANEKDRIKKLVEDINRETFYIIAKETKELSRAIERELRGLSVSVKSVIPVLGTTEGPTHFRILIKLLNTHKTIDIYIRRMTDKVEGEEGVYALLGRYTLSCSGLTYRSDEWEKILESKRIELIQNERKS